MKTVLGISRLTDEGAEIIVVWATRVRRHESLLSGKSGGRDGQEARKS